MVRGLGWMALAGALACGCGPEVQSDADGDGITSALDCDDTDAGVGLPSTWYGDADGDGYGGAALSIEDCTAPEGFARMPDDCDDLDPMVHPGAPEVCNETDDDCDGLWDAEDPDIDATLLSAWYPDLDEDGWGDNVAPTLRCGGGTGWAAQDGDCDDRDDDTNPDEIEVCDGDDDDCDGIADEGTICVPEDVLTVTGQEIWTLALDEEGVYWADRGAGVYRVNRDGTDARQIGEGSDTRGIAVDTDHVYFVDGSERVSRAPREGGDTEVLVDLSDPELVKSTLGNGCSASSLFFTSVAVEADVVWVTTGESSCHPLFSVGTDGSGLRAYPVANDDLIVPSGLSVRDDVVWIGYPAAVLENGMLHVVTDDPFFVEGIAGTEDQVFFQDWTSLRAMDRDGSNLRSLDGFIDCGAGHYPWNVLLHEERVYYHDACSKEVRSVSVSGGRVTVHATGVAAISIAVEPGWLWWGQVPPFSETSILQRVRIPRVVDDEGSARR